MPNLGNRVFETSAGSVLTQFYCRTVATEISLAAEISSITRISLTTEIPSHRRSVTLDQRQEQLIDDRLDPGRFQRFEVHEQVVAHQVEGHGQDGGRDTVEVDLAAVVGAPVDHLSPPGWLLTEELVADLTGGHAGVSQQPGEGRGRGHGGEGGARLAGGGQQREQVTAQSAGIGGLDRAALAVVHERGEHELVLVGPAAVEHRDAGVGPRGDRLHRQGLVAGFDQLIPGRVEQRGFELRAAPAMASGLRAGCSHLLRLERVAFLIKPAYSPKRCIPLLVWSWAGDSYSGGARSG